MTIYTIGYEGICINDFLFLLRKHAIETVVDIRELPLSRKPGFSKNALSNTLNLGGLEYVHIPNLGCPKSIRNRYRNDGNWARYKEAFITHLDSQDEALADLASIAAISSCALLCFESDYNFCHRSMVANAVSQLSGVRVVHIHHDKIKTAMPAGFAPAFA